MSDFNPDEFLKEVTPSAAFDPHEFLAEKPEGPGQLESVARGGTQGATMGFADEISGAMGAAGEKVGGLFNDNLGKKSFKDLYKEYRDAYRKDDKSARAANPKSYMAGELGGGVATSFLPGVGVARGASGLRLAANAVGQGVAQGVGSSESDTVGGNALDAAKGGAAGLIGLGAGNLIAKAIPNAVQTGKYATAKAIEHLRPTPKVARVLGPDRLNAIGREALDSGAIQFGAKAGDTAERLASQRADVGGEIGKYIDEAGAAGRTANPADIAEKFQKEVIDPLKGQAANKANVAKLEQQKADFLEHYGSDAKLTPLQIEEEKRAVQGNINYLTDPNAAQEAQRGYAGVLKNAGEEAVNNPAFTAAKDRFGKIADAQSMAERTAGLTDSGTGMFQKLHDLSAEQIAAHALMNGEPLTAAAVAGGRAIARGKTRSAQAVGADMISKFLGKHQGLNKGLMATEGAVTRGAPAFARQNVPYQKADTATQDKAPEVVGKLATSEKGQQFAPTMAEAAAKGPDAFSAQYFLMSQGVPDFRSALDDEE